MSGSLKQIKPDEIENINSTKETLTTEKLRTLIGGELTDEEANEIILSIKKLVSLIVDYQYDYELNQQKETEPNIKQAA